MNIWIIIAIVYVVIGIAAYFLFINKWDKSQAEKIWYSIFWLPLIPLWILHKIYNWSKGDL